jgi:Spy/CpxP family protein refolding chaperone
MERQQMRDNRQETTDNRQQTMNNGQPVTGNRQQTAIVGRTTKRQQGSLQSKRLSSVLSCLLSVVFLSASCAPAPLQAQPMGGPPMGHMMRGDSPAMMLHMVLRQANLTADQQNQVRKIMESEHQSLRTLFTQLQAANNQLADKLFAPGTVQAADLTPQVQQITQLRQKLMEQGVKTALAIRAVLTPEQLTKVQLTKDRLEKLQAEMHAILESND